METTIYGTPKLGQAVAVRFNGSTYIGQVVAMRPSKIGLHARVTVSFQTSGGEHILPAWYIGVPMSVQHGKRLKGQAVDMSIGHAYPLAKGGAR